MLINKKKRIGHRVNFAMPTDHRVKVSESEKLDKNLRIEDVVKYDSDSDTDRSWSPWNGPKETGD